MGTVSVVPRSKALYIRSLAVLPAAQGLRIGERLLRKTENYAVACGFKIFTLSTGTRLHGAVRLYEKLGFSRCGIDDFHGTRLIVIEKHLESGK